MREIFFAKSIEEVKSILANKILEAADSRLISIRDEAQQRIASFQPCAICKDIVDTQQNACYTKDLDGMILVWHISCKEKQMNNVFDDCKTLEQMHEKHGKLIAQVHSLLPRERMERLSNYLMDAAVRIEQLKVMTLEQEFIQRWGNKSLGEWWLRDADRCFWATSYGLHKTALIEMSQAFLLLPGIKDGSSKWLALRTVKESIG